MFELQTISKGGDVYLKRWRILGYLSSDDNYRGKPVESKLPFTLRLHRFIRPDNDGACHNHPWRWAVSFILQGGYDELRIDPVTGEKTTRSHRAPALNIIGGDDYHMVTKLYGQPLTLFLTGPKRKGWGFLVNGEHVDWRKFLGIEKL